MGCVTDVVLVSGISRLVVGFKASLVVGFGVVVWLRRLGRGVLV